MSQQATTPCDESMLAIGVERTDVPSPPTREGRGEGAGFVAIKHID